MDADAQQPVPADKALSEVTAPTLAAMLQAHEQALVQYASRLLPGSPDLARDAVQEAFLRYHRARCGGNAIRNPKSWLYRVVHNLAMDQHRRQSRLQPWEPQMSDAQLEPSGEAVGTQVSRREAAALAVAELERLPQGVQRILLLKVCSGLTLREIAEATGQKQATVYYHLQAGLKQLAERLRERGIEDSGG